MKKKLVAIILALTIILTGTIAFAAPTQEDIQQAQRIVAVANLKIDIIVKVAQITPWDDAAYAVAITDEIGQDTIETLAEDYEVTAVCEYVSVVIDGHTVLIDPIKIIEF